MQTKKEVNLSSEHIGKLLFQLSLPAITAQIINVLYNMVDRMYIGHIPKTGAVALTGVGVTFPLIMIISAFAALVSMGGAPRASIMMGKGENEHAEKILGNCVASLTIISILLTIIFLIFGKKFLFLFGASKNTISYAYDYFSIYALGTLFVQFSLGLNAFITSQGFAKISMYTVLMGAICNIILDPIFIFVFNMGVKGAALASVLSQFISAIWVVYFLTGNKTILKIKPKYLKIKFSVILPVLALGLSPFIMQFTESILIVCFNSSLQKYGGDIAVGAMTILSSVMQFAMLPLNGLTQGAQPIISFNFGAKNKMQVQKTFQLLLVCSLIYSCIIWLLVMLFPEMFARIFSDTPELIEITKWSIRVYMACSFLFGAQIACQQTFIALGNAKYSIFLAVLRKIILLIPFIFILPLLFQDKVMAVFLAEPVADFIAVITTISLFSVQFKKTLQKL